MKQSHFFSSAFPDDLAAIEKLRSENLDFNEICQDLELMGQDLARLSQSVARNSEPGVSGSYADTRRSFLALRQEFLEHLQLVRASK